MFLITTSLVVFFCKFHFHCFYSVMLLCYLASFFLMGFYNYKACFSLCSSFAWKYKCAYYFKEEKASFVKSCVLVSGTLPFSLLVFFLEEKLVYLLNKACAQLTNRIMINQYQTKVSILFWPFHQGLLNLHVCDILLAYSLVLQTRKLILLITWPLTEIKAGSLNYFALKRN